MSSTQHSPTRCPVYLHPAAATSPAAVSSIQQATGLLVIIGGPQFAKLRKAQPAALPTFPADDFTPFGGDAA